MLYALSATNLTILLALLFVLARNIIKLVVEQRRAIPFARFRTRLVIALLGMTLIPALLVLIVGSELIRNNIDQFFNAPMANMVSSARDIASDYYANGSASSPPSRSAWRGGCEPLTSAVTPPPRGTSSPPMSAQERIDLVEIYRSEPARQLERRSLTWRRRSCPRAIRGASADRLARQVARTERTPRPVEQLQACPTVATSFAPRCRFVIAERPVRGVLIASEFLTGEFAARARSLTAAYEDYRQLEVQKPALATRVPLASFVMLTLMILVAATWLGLYLAKRITRPVQMLAAAADEIGAGHLDHRVDVQVGDEFASLIEAFNRMAGDLATSRRTAGALGDRARTQARGRRRPAPVRRNRARPHRDGRHLRRQRRPHPHLEFRGHAAAGHRLARRWPARRRRLRRRRSWNRSRVSSPIAARDGTNRFRRKCPSSRDGRELHLLVMVTPLRRAEGRADGVVDRLRRRVAADSRAEGGGVA